jgi:hypothetical protein
MIFWVANYYMSRTSYLLYKKWDVNTPTASDFTVQYEISPANWEFYKREVQKNANGKMDIYEFQTYLNT